MSSQGPGKDPAREVPDAQSFRGGLTGIALVTLATASLAVVAAVIVALALLIAG